MGATRLSRGMVGSSDAMGGPGAACEDGRAARPDLGHESVAALVDGLRRNDPSAVAELLRVHGGALLVLARSILGDEHAAHDAVQDGLVSALGAIDSLRDPRALGAWLRRTVANAALAQVRKRRRGRERSIDELLPTFHADGHRAHLEPGWSSAADRMHREELLGRVREAMDELPPTYREVLLLRDVAGIGTQETAVTLGITPNLVKVRLHRARQALRTLIGERVGAE